MSSFGHQSVGWDWEKTTMPEVHCTTVCLREGIDISVMEPSVRLEEGCFFGCRVMDKKRFYAKQQKGSVSVHVDLIHEIQIEGWRIYRFFLSVCLLCVGR